MVSYLSIEEWEATNELFLLPHKTTHYQEVSISLSKSRDIQQ